MGANALGEALEELVNSELMFRAGTGYVFKHALMQSTACESLLRSRRQELRGRTAQALEAGFPDIAANQPEVIVLHGRTEDYHGSIPAI